MRQQVKSSHTTEQHFPKVPRKLLLMEAGLKTRLDTDHLHFPHNSGLFNTTGTFLYTWGNTSNPTPCSISKICPCTKSGLSPRNKTCTERRTMLLLQVSSENVITIQSKTLYADWKFWLYPNIPNRLDSPNVWSSAILRHCFIGVGLPGMVGKWTPR